MSHEDLEYEGGVVREKVVRLLERKRERGEEESARRRGERERRGGEDRRDLKKRETATAAARTEYPSLSSPHLNFWLRNFLLRRSMVHFSLPGQLSWQLSRTTGL